MQKRWFGSGLWSRDQLMAKYAELLVQGLDPATVVRPVDPELEKARLAQEAAQLRMQRELETAKLKAKTAQRESQERLEMEKLTLEKNLEIERLALDKQKLDLKARKLDADLELQRLDLKRGKHKHDADFKSAELDFKDRTQNDEMNVIKRYGDALAQILSPQPDDVTDLPSYFRGVEEQFEQLKIPDKYRARLIYRYLSDRARTLCSRLEPDIREDYVRMKNVIMKEYGLTAKCFLDKFNILKKSANDTYILFSSKLRGLLLQYLHERKVTNFDDLVSLLVSDRIKSSLTLQCLKYVLSIENNLPVDKQQWLDPQRLAEIVDEHIGLSYVGLANTRASYIGQQTASGRGRYQSHWQNKYGGTESGGASSHKFESHKPQQQGQGYGKNNFGRKCTLCQSTLHYKSECDKF